MKKTVLAFDIGESYIKMACRENDKIRVFAEQLPANLVQDGTIQMPHMMTDFLKDMKKEYHVPKGECGVIIPEELTVCRKLTLPVMTEKQLQVNLPFEFSDYISEEANKYVYDYALEKMEYDEEGKPTEMHLTGAAMSKESANTYVTMFRTAGFNLKTLIPQEVAMTNIMKAALADGRIEADKEYCIADLGHRYIQMYIFKGATLEVLRNIHMGNMLLDQVIAEHENVDEFVARTYKNTNYNEILRKDYVRETMSQMAIEIMKVINFYRFNNREAELEDIYFMGGGSSLDELCDSITEVTGLSGRSIMNILPRSVEVSADLSGVLAIGVLLQ